MKNKDRQFNKPEILAPAGTKEALSAAVNAGCDAVYLGGDLFSARAFAGNFSEEDLIKSLDYCHLFDIKIYMTVNTLMKQSEILSLEDYMRTFYNAGLDGVIIQDMGAAMVLKEAFPLLDLHASTQMSISSEYGARLLKSMGFTRIVPARELSLKEIRKIKENSDIEIESFVHGAMCYACSGKCLFSSFMGGRSGNRGRCAQPCRQCYEIIGSRQQDSRKEYAMSMKDMCTLDILPELKDAGIDSFKIEGRMKNPYYVAATVDAYRTALDVYLEMLENEEAGNFAELSESARQRYKDLARELTFKMQDIYNRGGFSSGYYFMKNGPEMIASQRPNHMGLEVGSVTKVKGPLVSVSLKRDVYRQDVLEIRGPDIELTAGDGGQKGAVISLNGKELKKIRPGMKVFRTRNNHLLEEIEERIIKPEKKVLTDVRITAREGLPLRIFVSDKKSGISILAEGNILSEASSLPTSKEQLMEKMRKAAGTNIMPEVTCETDENVFVPMSEFNNLRREAFLKFKEKMAGRYHRDQNK